MAGLSARDCCCDEGNFQIAKHLCVFFASVECQLEPEIGFLRERTLKFLSSFSVLSEQKKKLESILESEKKFRQKNNELMPSHLNASNCLNSAARSLLIFLRN